MTLKLLDMTNLLPIRTIHAPNSIMPSALGRGEVFRRMRLKLLEITNLLPIRMMHHPQNSMPSAMRTDAAF
jgi:hypothetical protein